MTTQTITFDYGMGERVRIKDLGLHGQVVAVSANVSGNTYRVVWWAESTRKDEWLYAWELETA